MEAKIGNAKQLLFDGMDPDRVYYSDFGDTKDSDDNVLPYGEEIQYQKEIEVNKAYIKVLDNYIGSKVVVPGKDSIPVLDQVKRRKQDALVNPIDKEHSNPIIDTRVHELELLDGRVDKYAVNIIIENLIDQVDDQEWDTGFLE